MGIEGNNFANNNTNLAERILHAKQVMEENEELARPKNGEELGLASVQARVAYGKAKAELAKLEKMERLNPDIDITDPTQVPVTEKVNDSNSELLIDSLVTHESMGEDEIRIGDYKSILLTTDSDNKYLIEKIPTGGLKMTNMKTGVVVPVQEDLHIKRNEVFRYSNRSQTSPIVSWTTTK